MFLNTQYICKKIIYAYTLPLNIYILGIYAYSPQNKMTNLTLRVKCGLATFFSLCPLLESKMWPPFSRERERERE